MDRCLNVLPALRHTLIPKTPVRQFTERWRILADASEAAGGDVSF